MSAFEVYLIMQMDAISSTIVAATAGSMILGPFAILFVCGFAFIEKRIPQRTAIIISGCIATFIVAMLAASSICPNSKTLAAMYVVPAIANNETLSSDAAEIYELAVDRLREVLDAEEAEVPE
ncbi:MAG: hypothetical protein HRT64_12705 [Erythrobacter sp.]|nr:hypothetical protein [Erythrobacter sp.]